MNSVNKTLYIPLYGKAFVSKKRLFLDDKKAEEIWESEGFLLKGKSKSKWLAYYMGVRSAVFDEWLKQQMAKTPEAVIIQIGCGMDSRILRVESEKHKWYDVDFPEVLQERKQYYAETDNYKMIAGDVRDCSWLTGIPENRHAIIVMEGVSMYLTIQDMHNLTNSLCNHFKNLVFLMDAYTTFAAKMSKRRNPINDVGVTEVYGIDNPQAYQNETLLFVKEHTMIPQKYIDELPGIERLIFATLYAGDFSKNCIAYMSTKRSNRYNSNMPNINRLHPTAVKYPSVCLSVLANFFKNCLHSSHEGSVQAVTILQPHPCFPGRPMYCRAEGTVR